MMKMNYNHNIIPLKKYFELNLDWLINYMSTVIVLNLDCLKHQDLKDYFAHNAKPLIMYFVKYSSSKYYYFDTIKTLVINYLTNLNLLNYCHSTENILNNKSF